MEAIYHTTAYHAKSMRSRGEAPTTVSPPAYDENGRRVPRGAGTPSPGSHLKVLRSLARVSRSPTVRKLAAAGLKSTRGRAPTPAATGPSHRRRRPGSREDHDDDRDHDDRRQRRPGVATSADAAARNLAPRSPAAERAPSPLADPAGGATSPAEAAAAQAHVERVRAAREGRTSPSAAAAARAKINGDGSAPWRPASPDRVQV